MNGQDLDASVRIAAFAFLEELSLRFGQALPREALLRGFTMDGTRVPLLGPPGIFKPGILPKTPGIPLSITTVPAVAGKPRPYDDSMDSSGVIRYHYRREGPQHRDNVGLRQAMQRRVPLIYFLGLVEGRYAAAWPVYIVGDDPQSMTFTVQVDDARTISVRTEGVAEQEVYGRRSYITVVTKRRLHQASFRERVLEAYRECCAICRLRHRELLDAAHILPDGDPDGEPSVTNGLSLCKIHHAAFDQNIVGISPDYRIEIREDVLREVDGPMLTHGLQDLHDTALVVVPAKMQLRPNREFLARRYDLFRKAG